jgi:hypothetical protein
MEEESDVFDELSSFAGTETGRWSLLTRQSVKSAVVRGVLLLTLAGTGMALIVALTAAMSHHDRVRLQWSSWMDYVRDSRVFQMRRSRRYLSMKTKLMLISGAEAFDDEMSPQHSALGETVIGPSRRPCLFLHRLICNEFHLRISSLLVPCIHSQYS